VPAVKDQPSSVIPVANKPNLKPKYKGKKKWVGMKAGNGVLG